MVGLRRDADAVQFSVNAGLVAPSDQVGARKDMKEFEEVLGLCTGELSDGRIPNGADNLLIDNEPIFEIFSECTLNSNEK